MAYNPTTWTTGDTITATAMNKIENGIANVGGKTAIVKIQCTTPTNTFFMGYCYGEPVTNAPCDVSIESDPDIASNGINISNIAYRRVEIIAFPLDPDGVYKTYLCFDEYAYTMLGSVQATGGVSSTPLPGMVKLSSSEWLSRIFYLYEVTGDGTLTFTVE